MIVSVGYSQISPGDLSSAHSELEGMSNCTMCHDLGKKVSNSKCLDCHKEIQLLIKQKHGYHASREVKGKDCFECHSEHHGRNFDMVRFDEDNFNHALTQFKLEGKHAIDDCRKCHRSENIGDPEIRKRKNTFLGLDQKCLSCHDDFHQNTMSKDCFECHDLNNWRPAPKFDHGKTDFVLKGAHAEVDCKECHATSMRNGKEYQAFSNLQFKDCASCHDDPHNNNLMANCKQCHTETSFQTFTGRNVFDHNSTGFTLKGQHRSVDCFQCHKENSNPSLLFKDRSDINENNCNKCHEDVHDGKFGKDCAKCHQEKSFVAVKSMDDFDHSVTDFPLEGLHISVDCKKCHQNRYTESIDFSACSKCHTDYHESEFTNIGSPDCKECHSLTEGFGFSAYSIQQHQLSEFPLEGAHLATPCFACHLSEERWTFRNIGETCMDCHDNVHGESFDIEGVTDCNRCHQPENWFPVKFDHSITQFPLDGKHAEIACNDCHKEYVENGIVLIRYKIEKFECIDCHQ